MDTFSEELYNQKLNLSNNVPFDNLPITILKHDIGKNDKEEKNNDETNERISDKQKETSDFQLSQNPISNYIDSRFRSLNKNIPIQEKKLTTSPKYDINLKKSITKKKLNFNQISETDKKSNKLIIEKVMKRQTKFELRVSLNL
jgi:hypothetical protein